MDSNASFEELVAALAGRLETPTKAVGAGSRGRTKRPPALSPAAAAGGGRPGSHSRRAAPLFESIAGGGDVAMPGLEYASEEDDDDSETRRAKQARRAKAGEATAAAVAELRRMRGGQQERKQYKRSTTSYGLRKLPKPLGCRKCKGNARGCRIKDHQLEDASDVQVCSALSTVLDMLRPLHLSMESSGAGV